VSPNKRVLCLAVLGVLAALPLGACAGKPAAPGAVEFVTARVGWGYGDSILRTTDGGASWQEQKVPALPHDSGFSISSLTAVDPEHAWAVGSVNPWSNVNDSTGFILGTDDGGAHWRVQRYQESPMLFDVAFADTRTGWVIGGPWPDMVLSTTDGGAHWQRSPFPAKDANMTSVCCTDERHVWVFGAPTMVFASDDGGHAWRVIRTGLADKVAVTGGSSLGGEMQFLDGRHGWLVGGQDASILVTTDGGLHWDRQKLPPMTDMRYLVLGSIHFTDLRHGRVGGEVITWPKKQNTDYYAVTSDGGLHWRRVPPLK
jgi:photosystem II stability/assembly factor-like uncharacterized protein